MTPLVDPALPSLPLALDRDAVRAAFKHRLPRIAGGDGVVRVRGIRVIRHKPGRRALIEYDLRVDRAHARERLRLLGKMRARRYGKEGFSLQDGFWRHGFRDDSADGISVPEPVGAVPSLRLWLQRVAPGRVATDLLASPRGIELATRVADAAHKLHEARVPAPRRHTVADELRILHRCLDVVVADRPEWTKRLGDVRRACDRVGCTLEGGERLGIHRDFYADQVLVDGDRLYVIDLDLYCTGDPALDIGNFIGHVTEQSLRTTGDQTALVDVEAALEERFAELAGSSVRQRVRGYALLTLVRHVYLAHQSPDRRSLTESLLELCEQRLASALPRTRLRAAGGR